MKILKELIEIKKELQNIRVILQSQFVQDYKVVKRENIDGEYVRFTEPIEDPLGELRDKYRAK